MFRDLSLNLKLVVLTSLAVMLGLLVSCTAFWINDARTIRQAKVDQLLGICRTLAVNCTGVLTFQDNNAAHELLSSLESHTFIEQACLRDSEGHVFAWIGHRPVRQQADVSPEESWVMTGSQKMIVTVPVADLQMPDDVLGTLTIVSSTDQMVSHFWNFLAIVAGTVLLALLVAVVPLVVMHREVSRPILALAETAESISENEDYSFRVFRDSGDEIGMMYQAFNGLLDRVQQSEHEIMLTQQDLIAARERAEHGSRAKSEFLANMSHEIRTPLTGILGFTDLLIAEVDPEDTRRYDYLNTIQQSGKHLLSLINDILDLSKIEAGQLNVERIMCSPHQTISEVVSVLRVKAIEKDLSFEYRWITDVPPLLPSDPARLRQLILNLVGNAIKFTSSGGVAILASIEPSRDGGSNSMLVVEVTDTGVGIAPDKLDQIFSPFVQADTSVTRKFGGTGLGLAIAKKLAKLLGGDLTVNSEPGKGSTFRLEVDGGQIDPSQMVQAEVADAMIASPKKTVTAAPKEIGLIRVLLVEDGEVNRKFVRLVLKRSGAEVMTAENGAIGADLALQEDFDIVLMDMQMPVMDGYTATRKLRAAGFDKPIIALTAHAMVGDREQCINAGCTDYLTKPIDVDELLGMLAKHAQLKPATQTPDPEPEAVAAPAQALQSTLPCDDDPEFQEIVEEFEVRLNEKLDLMEAAISCDNSEELAQLAHWLKGAGGTAGFADFTDPAARLEQASRSGDEPTLRHHLTSLRHLAGRIELPWKDVCSSS